MIDKFGTIDKLILARDTLLAIHLLSAAIWVGGMAYVLLVLRPALAALEPAAKAMQMHLLTLKKFFLIVWHVMPLMLLTGWGMVFMVWGSMKLLPWNINAMQGLGVLMALIFIAVYFGPYKRAQRAIRATPEMLGRIRMFVVANFILGCITIIMGSLGHVW